MADNGDNGSPYQPMSVDACFHSRCCETSKCATWAASLSFALYTPDRTETRKILVHTFVPRVSVEVNICWILLLKCSMSGGKIIKNVFTRLGYKVRCDAAERSISCHCVAAWILLLKIDRQLFQNLRVYATRTRTVFTPLAIWCNSTVVPFIVKKLAQRRSKKLVAAPLLVPVTVDQIWAGSKLQ